MSYALVGLILIGSAFGVLARYRADTFENYRDTASYEPLSDKQMAELQHFLDLSPEDQLASAHAIVLCRHEPDSGRTHCSIERYLKFPEEGGIPYAPGDAIISHERVREGKPAGREEGTITFFIHGSRMPIKSLYIYRGHVGFDSRSRNSISVEHMESLINAANQTMEPTGDTRTGDFD